MTISVITTPRSASICVRSEDFGARLLCQEVGREVMFTSITFLTSLDAVRGFAGDEYVQAVVEDAARRALTRWVDLSRTMR